VSAEELKRAAGERAADFVEEGMVVGMGTGTTVLFTIRKLGERVREGLAIRAVSTSEETSKLCGELGIPLVSLDDVAEIDLTIDGADEVDRHLDGIKGGHGALLREKIVAINSRRNIWVVDEGKLVEGLVRDTVPLEAVAAGVGQLMERLREKGYAPELRKDKGVAFRTDEGNVIVDVRPGRTSDARELEREWKLLTGVVECGLFLGIADTVVVGRSSGVEILRRS
jgi:ribose 5-phosphate isomerase A